MDVTNSVSTLDFVDPLVVRADDHLMSLTMSDDDMGSQSGDDYDDDIADETIDSTYCWPTSRYNAVIILKKDPLISSTIKYDNDDDDDDHDCGDDGADERTTCPSGGHESDQLVGQLSHSHRLLAAKRSSTASLAGHRPVERLNAHSSSSATDVVDLQLQTPASAAAAVLHARPQHKQPSPAATAGPPTPTTASSSPNLAFLLNRAPQMTAAAMPPTPPSSTCGSDSEAMTSCSSSSSASAASVNANAGKRCAKSSTTSSSVVGSASSMASMATTLISVNPRNAVNGSAVLLTEEEKRTLVAEGYPIPQRFPLTKAEERSLKKIRRKIKNKISAQESRRKKKEYMEDLERRVQQLDARVRELERENKQLLQMRTTTGGVTVKSEPTDVTE